MPFSSSFPRRAGRSRFAATMVCGMLAASLAHAKAQSTDAPVSPPDTKAQPAKRPCQDPDAAGDYRIGCGVQPPRVLDHPDPQFSEDARKKKIGGNVLLSLTVDADGNPTDIKVVRSLADKIDPKFRKAALSLDEKAIEAVERYKFAPAMYQGKPVPVTIHVEVNFQIF